MNQNYNQLSRAKFSVQFKAFCFVLPVAWSPVFFVYFQNSAEANFSQVWLPLGMLTAVAAIYCLLFTALTRNVVAGGVTAMVAVLLTTFWRPIEDAARNICWSIHYWHLVPLALAGCLVLAVGLSKVAHLWPMSLIRIRAGLCALFSLLIVYNFVLAAPVLWEKVQIAVFAGRANDTVRLQEIVPGNHPNVYFIILDEYAPFPMMKKYYGYVPIAFDAFLKEQKFNVSSTSHNASFNTADVLAGLVGMKLPKQGTSYTLTADGRVNKLLFFPKSHEKIIAESKLMHFFKAWGYTIYVASMLDDIFNIPTPLFCDVHFQLPVDQRGESLENTIMSVMLERSMFDPVKFVLPIDAHYYNKMVEGIFKWIQDSSQKAEPRFLWAHVVCPHPPYLFHRDGSWRQEKGSGRDHRDYLEQYQYVTTRITEVLTSLLALDPDCVILLMSDHSVRQNMTIPVKDMSRIFNAVYFRGKNLDIEGLSGLDTELLVLNHLFGTDFPVFRGQRPLAGVIQ